MSAVDGLKARFLELSAPDADGVYRDGAGKRRARTALAMDRLRALWDEACAATSFVVPDRGVGLAATGSLSRGQNRSVFGLGPGAHPRWACAG